MNGWLLAVVGVIYLAVGVGTFKQQRYGMTVVYLAYAVSVVGLVIAEWEARTK